MKASERLAMATQVRRMINDSALVRISVNDREEPVPAVEVEKLTTSVLDYIDGREAGMATADSDDAITLTVVTHRFREERQTVKLTLPPSAVVTYDTGRDTLVVKERNAGGVLAVVTHVERATLNGVKLDTE